MEFYKAYLDIPLPERLVRTNRLLYKYPQRIPIIIDRFKSGDPEVKQHKFLLESSMIMSQFVYLLRKQLSNNLGPEHALFLFDKKTYSTLNMSATIGELHKHIVDPDGCIHLVYSLEATFG